ncbi:HAMP domain-containing sensor histidine kinase [Pseudomonas sp. 43NM1]|uniref:sensor histidine kinase n=1 Tax=Pseudomonas sp. 43NM1 TaxID=1904755 RepID=UPI000C32B0F1|nr:ATP-binding protein [Pseudomonas sp. 43NM1]
MKIRYRILNASGNIIFCNLSANEIASIDSIETTSMRIATARAGVISNTHGKVYGFSEDKDYVASSQKFKSALNAINDCAPSVASIFEEAREAANKNTRRLLHNLTNLNAHNIQEIYSLLPQEMLANRTSGQVSLVEELIKKDMRDSALAFLRIAKNNAAMKTEFSVFNKLYDKNPKLQKKSHNVHKVLMNVFYIFFSDFTDKDVKVTVECEGIKTAYFDYESIHVALFQVIENSVKYIKPRSDLLVKIIEADQFICIRFQMNSLQIQDSELGRIFEEGFSGGLSEKTGKSGSGIGLSIAKDILVLNAASIEVEVKHDSLSELFGIPYQLNIFTIKLPRKS